MRKTAESISCTQVWKKTTGLQTEFLQLCLQEATSTRLVGSSLQSGSWQNIITSLKTKFNITFEQKQLKNKWDSLKADYEIWRRMKAKTGGGFDGKYFDWPAEVWESYLLSYPKAKKFRNKTLKDADLLESLFEGILAAGDGIYQSGDNMENAGNPDSIPDPVNEPEDDHFVAEYTFQEDDDYDGSPTPLRSPFVSPGPSTVPSSMPSQANAQRKTSTAGTSKLASRRRKRSSINEEKRENLGKIIDLLEKQSEKDERMLDILEKGVQDKQARYEAQQPPEMDSVLNVLYALNDVVAVPPGVNSKALKAFCDNPAYMKIFMLLRDENAKLEFLLNITGMSR